MNNYQDKVSHDVAMVTIKTSTAQVRHSVCVLYQTVTLVCPVPHHLLLPASQDADLNHMNKIEVLQIITTVSDSCFFFSGGFLSL